MQRTKNINIVKIFLAPKQGMSKVTKIHMIASKIDKGKNHFVESKLSIKILLKTHR